MKNLKDTEVLNSQSTTEFEVLYFTSQADADANINEITTLYTNSSAYSSDTLIARIHNIQNTTCYETESFEITVYENPNPPLTITVLGQFDSNLVGIDTDGLEIFDLQEK